VVFDEGTDIYFARQLVFERLQDAKEQIPAGTGVPEIGPNTSGLGQVFQYILRAEEPGATAMRRHLRRAQSGNLRLLLNVVNLGEVFLSSPPAHR